MSTADEEIKSFYKKIGDNLRAARLSKNLSQLDLATITDLEKTTISRIENGRTNVTAKTIFLLAESLNIKASSLFDTN